ncbi:MAG: hypothetical protein ACLFM7_00405 [Bacteroidales bacterium]
MITIALFISTVVIYKQHHYMTAKKLGFDKDKVLVIDRAYYLDKSLGSVYRGTTFQFFYGQ